MEHYIAVIVTALFIFKLFEFKIFKRFLSACIHRFSPNPISRWIEEQERSLAAERERVEALYRPKKRNKQEAPEVGLNGNEQRPAR